MKVKELIEVLQQFDGESKVLIDADTNMFHHLEEVYKSEPVRNQNIVIVKTKELKEVYKGKNFLGNNGNY